MGKSSSPPPAPDYAGAAQATAQGNLEATRAATEANRINQYTPYGSLTYARDPNAATPDSGWSQSVNLNDTVLEYVNSFGMMDTEEELDSFGEKQKQSMKRMTQFAGGNKEMKKESKQASKKQVN
jgi:hypothetical protein